MSKTELVSKGLQDYIFKSKYARFDDKLQRRENWDEAVDRVCNMHIRKFADLLSKDDLDKIRWAFTKVKEKKVLPSMRSLQFGGKAIEAKNERNFNCSARFIDSIRAFAEIGYLMLCGTGTGIGLSKKFLDRLPDLVSIDDDHCETILTYTIEDTIEGWADSLEALVLCYVRNNALSGREIFFDYSKIRRKGSLLKTGGGRAPGYKPLKKAHIKIKKLLDHLVKTNNQQRLRSIDVYDILMYFSDAVLSGGIRRSASSIIFDADDEDMLNAKIYYTVDKFIHANDVDKNEEHVIVWLNKKKYDIIFNLDLPNEKYDFDELVNNKKIGWRYIHPQRARSNNSMRLLRDICTKEQFRKIVNNAKLFGEPAFVFCDNELVCPNPCFEINFIPVKDGQCGVQFCNLTSINANNIKSREEFLECLEAQVIIGTLQATYTNFPYLGNVSKEITEDEALLGCSITGILDNPDIFLNEEILREGARYTVKINEIWAAKLGINKAARICTCKPEGTLSLTVGAAPGIHPHHSKKYFRRVQVNKDEDIYQFFKIYNDHMCEESVWNTNTKDDVITFPITAPKNALTKKDLSAIEHLEIIKKVQQNWIIPSQKNNKKNIDHNVSCTVIVKDDEWDSVIDYLFENRKFFSAVSLLSHASDKIYPQAPFEEVVTAEDREKFDELVDKFQSVDYNNLAEESDQTTHASEPACAGGKCLV